ncbi:MAG: RNA-binding protein [Pseudomonadota bacterium]|nr:RNA-binding protein [Pseudomonadota bacterium]
MNLYVSNIPPGVMHADLQHIFSGFGEVLYASLMPASNSRSDRGYAFIYVPDEDRARTAIARLNGAVLKGDRLAVSPMAERRGVIGHSSRLKS